MLRLDIFQSWTSQMLWLQKFGTYKIKIISFLLTYCTLLFIICCISFFYLKCIIQHFILTIACCCLNVLTSCTSVHIWCQGMIQFFLLCTVLTFNNIHVNICKWFDSFFLTQPWQSTACYTNVLFLDHIQYHSQTGTGIRSSSYSCLDVLGTRQLCCSLYGVYWIV